MLWLRLMYTCVLNHTWGVNSCLTRRFLIRQSKELHIKSVTTAILRNLLVILFLDLRRENVLVSSIIVMVMYGFFIPSRLSNDLFSVLRIPMRHLVWCWTPTHGLEVTGQYNCL